MLATALLVSLASGAAPETFPTFEDKGELFVKAGKKQGLQVGSEVELLGARIGDTEERRSLGRRTVMEVWDALARLSGAEGPGAEKPERARLPAREPAKKAQAGAASSAQKKEGGGPAQTSAAMGFSDHLTAECGGHRFDVWARSTLLGGNFMLQIDGKEVQRRDVNVGQLETLSGKAGGASASLTVNQGAFGTDYSLTVGGKRCPLTNL